MSKLNSVSSQWPSDFLFSKEHVPSNDLQLEEQQRLSRFICDLGRKLCLTDRCIYTAIVYMHRFFMIQSNTQCYSLRLCQASILLACNSEQLRRDVKDIHYCTAGVMKMPINKSPEMCQFVTDDIIDYLNILIKTLGVGIRVNDPYALITKKIQDLAKSLTKITKYEKIFFDILISNEFKYFAGYLAKKTILLTQFCVRYSSDLIACFCIRLSIEIKNDMTKSTIQLDKSFTSKEVRNLIYEFHVIFKNYVEKNKEKFDAKEYEFNNKILSCVTHLIQTESIPLGLAGEKGAAHPFLSPPNTSEQNSLPTSSSLVTHQLSYDPCTSDTDTAHKNSPINRISQAVQLDAQGIPVQPPVSNSNKRPNDSSNDNKTCKRSSSFLQQR